MFPLAVLGVVANVDPYAVVRPYSTLIVVLALLAFTLALTVAALVVIALDATFEIVGKAVETASKSVKLAMLYASPEVFPLPLVIFTAILAVIGPVPAAGAVHVKVQLTLPLVKVLPLL